MEKLFGKIIRESSDQLSDHSPVRLPAEYASNQKGPIRFTAHFYRHASGEMRAVYIEGPKIEIVNLFYFPEAVEDWPIYAMEFVQMGRRAVVGVIDVAGNEAQSKATNEATSIIRPIRERYPDLVQGDDPPGWFQECRSGNDFFVRPEGSTQLNRLCEAHLEVFERYCAVLRTQSVNVPATPPEESAGGWQARYKAHHATNSPGLPFLNRTFGEDWAQTFLHEHLFA